MDLIKKRALKMAVDLIGRENIAKILQEITGHLWKVAKEFPLTEYESRAVGILAMHDGELYLILATMLKDEKSVSRILKYYKVSDIIEDALKKI